MLKIIGGVAGGIILAVLIIKFWVYLLWAIAGLITLFLLYRILLVIGKWVLACYGETEKDNRTAGLGVWIIVIAFLIFIATI